jgi:hypothetical protein
MFCRCVVTVRVLRYSRAATSGLDNPWASLALYVTAAESVDLRIQWPTGTFVASSADR